MLARFETIQPLIDARCMFVYFCVQREYVDRCKAVTLPHNVVVEIVRGRDFYAASAESWIDIFIGDDGNSAIAQWQLQTPADQVLVAHIFRMYRDSNVAEQRFRACGGDD